MKYTLFDLKCAFLAGLIDCDGSIMLRAGKDTRKRYRITFGMFVKISNTKKALLDFAEKNFGGRIGKYQPKAKNRSLLYEWIVTGEKAKSILESVYPYLIIKKKQATLAMRFQDILSVASRGGSAPCTQDEYDEKAGMVKEMHRLNAKGGDKTWVSLDRQVLLMPK